MPAMGLAFGSMGLVHSHIAGPFSSAAYISSSLASRQIQTGANFWPAGVLVPGIDYVVGKVGSYLTGAVSAFPLSNSATPVRRPVATPTRCLVATANTTINDVDFRGYYVTAAVDGTIFNRCVFDASFYPSAFYTFQQTGAATGAQFNDCSFIGSPTDTTNQASFVSYQAGSISLNRCFSIYCPNDAHSIINGSVTNSAFIASGINPNFHGDGFYIPQTTANVTLQNNFVDIQGLSQSATIGARTLGNALRFVTEQGNIANDILVDQNVLWAVDTTYPCHIADRKQAPYDVYDFTGTCTLSSNVFRKDETTTYQHAYPEDSTYHWPATFTWTSNTRWGTGAAVTQTTK